MGAKSSACSGGHPYCLGNDHLVHDRNLATPQMGFICPSFLFDLGIACDGLAIVHDDLELGKMILRLSQKMTTKIKAGKLTELPLEANPYADWSSHMFNAGRTQYIILMNTVSFYSCLLPGKGITSEESLLSHAKETIGGFLADDGKQFVYSMYIAPAFSEVQLAKALSRSVTGSMNDHIHGAKTLLAHGMTLSEIGHNLNKTPMSALVGPDGKKYAYPTEVFASFADRIAGI